jgi:hypothetical protein
MYSFLTYADKEPYLSHARELVKSAIVPGRFDRSRVATRADLDSSFCDTHSDILSVQRGGGLWLYKPYIILKELLSMRDGDILCYCDSLYRFVDDFRPFMDEWLKWGDVALARNKPNEGAFLEIEWTKMDAYHIMGVPFESASETPQVWGGFLLLRKSLYTIRFVSAWLTYCTDHRLLSDSPSSFPNARAFKENRHDQSILSLLAKRWGIRFCEFPPNVLQNLRKPYQF